MMINSSLVPLGIKLGRYKYVLTISTLFTLRFSPESYECCALAGLLACSAFDNLPVPSRLNREKQWFKKDQKIIELTASGNAPDFSAQYEMRHRIPF